MPRDVVALTADLVRLPSVLGNEEAVAQASVESMRSLGFDLAEIDSAGNAIGVIDGHASGPTLVMDGHIDTVDVIPREAWTHDPFGAEVVGERMYGRGTSDMKGAVAAIICGVAAVDRSRIRGRIVVSASVGEEWVEGRALQCVVERYPADYVVIGEATQLNLVRAGRGRAEFAVTTQGTPAHASTPHLGVNAVHKMIDVVREIEALALPNDAFVGPGIMALTDLKSSPYPGHSVIPSACRATYERRLIPGETEERVLAELREAAARAGAPDTSIAFSMLDYTTYTGTEWRQPKWFPAWETPEDSVLVARALEGLRSARLDPQFASYQFCTNGAYSAGIAGIPTIGFGPSDEALAHTVDEYIELDQLEIAVAGYRALAEAVLA